MITKERFIEICEFYGLKRFPDEYSTEGFWYEIPGIDAEVCQFGSSKNDEWKDCAASYSEFWLNEYGCIKELGELKKCENEEDLRRSIESVIESVKKIKKRKRKEMIDQL